MNYIVVSAFDITSYAITRLETFRLTSALDSRPFFSFSQPSTIT
jgi:hypothetical protein